MIHLLDNHYLTFVMLLLSISSSMGGYFAFAQFRKFWNESTKTAKSNIPELLSLLMLPSTYGEGIELLKTITPYKYFMPLIQDLVARQRQSGVTLRPNFEELRRAIHLDLQYENEQRNFIKQSCGQFFSYILLTWGMCAFFAYYGLKLALGLYLSIAIMHLAGLVGLFIFIRKQQIEIEKIFLSFVPTLYQVMTAHEITLNQLAEECNQSSEINHLVKALKSLVVKRNKFGVSIAAELNLLAQEFWFIWEFYGKKNKQKIERVKFALMMLVFGGAYMLILYGISSQVAASIFS